MNPESCYADGGEVEDKDNEDLMDHVAMEGIHAFHNKDKSAFRDAFHVLVAHTLGKMSPPESEEE